MADNTVGTVRGKLQLVIGEADPIPLTTIALPIRILNGTDYTTYSLKIDLAEVTDTIQAIFTTAEAKIDLAEVTDTIQAIFTTAEAKE